jgi:hypothetical protein
MNIGDTVIIQRRKRADSSHPTFHGIIEHIRGPVAGVSVSVPMDGGVLTSLLWEKVDRLMVLVSAVPEVEGSRPRRKPIPHHQRPRNEEVNLHWGALDD